MVEFYWLVLVILMVMGLSSCVLTWYCASTPTLLVMHESLIEAQQQPSPLHEEIPQESDEQRTAEQEEERASSGASSSIDANDWNSSRMDVDVV